MISPLVRAAHGSLVTLVLVVTAGMAAAGTAGATATGHVASTLWASRAQSAAPVRKVGQTSPSNTGDVGQCTWWVQDRFKAYTGHYPLLHGNAKDYATSAASNGWTVVSKPQPHSIVVFQPGDPNGANPTDGHVAWVTKVSGNKLTVTEMNWTYSSRDYPKGKSDTRTVTYHPGVGERFILAK